MSKVSESVVESAPTVVPIDSFSAIELEDNDMSVGVLLGGVKLTVLLVCVVDAVPP